MELRQLRYFVKVCELRSMGRAAVELGLVTSALSQQISRLESELSTRLLQRSSIGVTPTDSGVAFLQQAQLTLRHADEAVRAAQQARLSGHVSVGLSPTTASVLGLPLMQAMQARYPDVRLHLVESLSGNLASMLQARQLDLAVLFETATPRRWSIEPLLDEKLDVLVIGGGNAALCAALMAREAGASVLLLEAAPREWRGGNSQHTRNLRCMHDAPQDVLLEAYPRRRVLAGPAEGHRRQHRRAAGPAGDPRLVDLPRLDAQARRALPAAAGRHAAPVAHQRLLHGRRQGAGQRVLPQRRKPGRADPLRHAGRPARAADGPLRGGAREAGERIEARACVLASGGFESNREWLREAWGQNERGEWPADNFLIRGTRFNQGVLLKHMMEARAPTSSATRRRRTAWPSTRARRCTTAAS
jgi:DNA-binding transcriptional LysR family regulator